MKSLSHALICTSLPVNRVRSLVEQLGIPGKTRSREDLAATLSASSSAALPRLLELASRDDLKELCRACGVDDGGREKNLIISRLKTTINPTLQHKAQKPMATLNQVDDDSKVPPAAESEADSAGEDSEGSDSPDSQGAEDDHIYDWIKGGENKVKDTPREQVRQRVARMLFHQYNIAPEDMVADFPIPGMGKKGRSKEVDLAIFEPGHQGEITHLRRLVICREEPKQGKRGSIKLRDYDQATEDLEQLKEFMGQVQVLAQESSKKPEAAEVARYGLWTNGLEQFFVEKIPSRMAPRYEPRSDWPAATESGETVAQASEGYNSTRKAEGDALRIAFRRCHNFLHGNEGHGKEQAFRQFLILIFCKQHDEGRGQRVERLFKVGFQEPFTDKGRAAIRERIQTLFEEVKKKYPTLFSQTDAIELSDRALSYIVAELSRYDFLRTDLESKGSAYQEIVGPNLRGDLGQYFTPPAAVRLLVSMVNPGEEDRVLDPACGTGGFLVACIAHRRAQMKASDATSEILDVQRQLGAYVEKCIYGCDFNEFLVKASRMNLVMNSEKTGNLFHFNSLEFPNGTFRDTKAAKAKIPLYDPASGTGGLDVVLANPPFGKDIPITEPSILKDYELARNWESDGAGGYRPSPGDKRKPSVEPQILFLERCIEWLKPGGKLGIVLPDGILGSPGTAYIRWWVMQRAYVLSSVKLPVESFLVDAKVGILTTLLVLKKKAEVGMPTEDYPVFMAVAENVGFDRRGSPRYKRNPDGTEVPPDWEDFTEQRRIDGKVISKLLRRRKRQLDNDLPDIANAYRAFRAKYPEPGT